MYDTHACHYPLQICLPVVPCECDWCASDAHSIRFRCASEADYNELHVNTPLDLVQWDIMVWGRLLRHPSSWTRNLTIMYVHGRVFVAPWFPRSMHTCSFSDSNFEHVCSKYRRWEAELPEWQEACLILIDLKGVWLTIIHRVGLSHLSFLQEFMQSQSDCRVVLLFV